MAEPLTLSPSTVDDASVDIFALDSYDDAQLDDLRFGVICLDAEGTIHRYNLAEARLARLDRSRVLGRDFFRKVAPCTATPEFEGRFRAFLQSQEPRLAFPFVFDFKFGAQNVTVELVRAQAPGASISVSIDWALARRARLSGRWRRRARPSWCPTRAPSGCSATTPSSAW